MNSKLAKPTDNNNNSNTNGVEMNGNVDVENNSDTSGMDDIRDATIVNVLITMKHDVAHRHMDGQSDGSITNNENINISNNMSLRSGKSKHST